MDNITTDAPIDMPLHDRRMGPESICKNCIHAYPMKISLVQEVLECRAAPPQYAIAVGVDARTGQIVKVQPYPYPVPRTVPENYFCGQFQFDPAKAGG